MFCTKCGGEIANDSRFCKHCGVPVEPESASATPSDESPGDKLKKAAAKPEKSADGKPAQADIYRDPKHEKQVWEGRPAWRSYWGLWFIWAFVSMLLLVVTIKWSGSGSALFKTLALFIIGAAVAIVVREFLVVMGLRYRLTTQRLFVHRGILTRVTDQMELIRVDDVQLRQGIVDRIVDTGDVIVIGTDETDENVTLQSIGRPAEVAEALRTHVRGVRSKNTLLVENI